MVWLASGVGIAVGAGFIGEAITTVLFVFVSIRLIPAIIWRIGPKSLHQKEIRLEIVVDKSIHLTRILKEMQEQNVRIKNVKVKDLDTENHYQLDIIATVDEKIYATDVYVYTKKINNVVSAKVETY